MRSCIMLRDRMLLLSAEKPMGTVQHTSERHAEGTFILLRPTGNVFS